MGCFHVQKTKKKAVEQAVIQADDSGDESDASSSSPSPRPVLSAPPSFRRTARIIQNAQRFILHSNPKLRSSHPSYGSRENRSDVTYSDVSTFSKPMPLPSPLRSPKLSPQLTGYVLPHPADNMHATASSPKPLNPKLPSSVVHGALNGRIVPWDLQPLPPPKEAVPAPKGLNSFMFDDLCAACRQFSGENLVGDDGMSYVGVIKAGLRGSKQQEVIVMRGKGNLHQEMKEWMCKLSDIVTRLHSPYICKLVGFYAADGTTERYLVYEKLGKGSLHNLLLDPFESPVLDWHTRMKIIVEAAEGLASLHESFPEQILYRDFRLSHIQVDNDFNSKLCGYCPMSTSQVSNSLGASRENAYCAPELIKEGTLTLKSNVWSFGVVLLEILCGRKNRDERLVKDEKYDLIKWAKPFLQDTDKLFLLMDRKLHGRFPSKGTKTIANLTLHCLQKDPARRPTMKTVLETVKAMQERLDHNLIPVTWKEASKNEMKAPMSAPLKPPVSAPLLSLNMSQSLKPGVVGRVTASYTSNRTSTKFDVIHSPELRPLIIPSRTCDD